MKMDMRNMHTYVHLYTNNVTLCTSSMYKRLHVCCFCSFVFAVLSLCVNLLIVYLFVLLF